MCILVSIAMDCMISVLCYVIYLGSSNYNKMFIFPYRSMNSHTPISMP